MFGVDGVFMTDAPSGSRSVMDVWCVPKQAGIFMNRHPTPPPKNIVLSKVVKRSKSIFCHPNLRVVQLNLEAYSGL